MKIIIEHIPDCNDIEVIIKGSADSEAVKSLVASLSNTETFKSQKNIIGKQEDKDFLLSIDEIEYFYSDSGLTFAFIDDRSYRIRATLKELESNLNIVGFRRISKSHLLNCHHIQYLELEFSGNYIIATKNGQTLLLSRNYVPGIKKFIQEEV